MTSFTACLIAALAGQAGASVPVSRPFAGDVRWALEIERDKVFGFRTARARNAPLHEIGKRLESVLNVPVHVSRAVAGSRLTFSMESVSLDDVLARLSPAVYIDSREAWGKSPELLAIHLLEDREVVTPTPGLVSEGIVTDAVDGETPSSSPRETPARGAEPAPVDSPSEGPFLTVRLADGRINIDSRSQGLGVLLFEVARVSGARFDLGTAAPPMVARLSGTGILPSELPGLLAIPGVGVDIRRNLLSGEQTALRYFVNTAP